MTSILGLYVKRWQRWVATGLQGITLELFGDVKIPSLTGQAQIER